MRRRTAASALALAALLTLTAGSAQATPGALDPTFGTGGKVTTAIGSGTDVANAIGLQPDGKIVAVGYSTKIGGADLALVRYNTDGSLDSSFGTGGKVTTAIGSAANALAIALQSDGKIVAGGYSLIGSARDFALARYNADGSLDSTFGSGGKVTTAIGPGNDKAYAVRLQADGKIVAFGLGLNGTSDDFALARYNADGSLDSSFGSGGTVTTAFGSGDDDAYAGVIQPDGKIVAVGSTFDGTYYDFALARYTSSGSLDTSFGPGGKATTAISSGDDGANGVVLQPDGKIVAAGYAYTGSNDDFAVVRYNADGSLDSSFGSGGKVTTAIGPSGDYGSAAALQPDGKIVVAGSSYNGANYDFAVVRYNADGSLDSSFGSGGKVTAAIGPGNDYSYQLALQADGKVVVGGFGWTGSKFDFALVRYLGSTLTVTKAGSGAGTITTAPAGIDCGSSCSSPFAAVPVTLTAKAVAGSSFAGWSGDCAGTGTCTLTMSADHRATATFETDKTLTVKKSGSGSGSVSSTPGGISCGSTCSHAYAHGTSVKLTASASSKSKFTGWSGDCSGTGSCTLAMSADHSATATFKVLCVVPKVKGKKLSSAKSAIKKAHCSVGKVTKAFSSKVKKGRVISQKPSSGKKLAAGSKVKLKVSKGKRT